MTRSRLLRWAPLLALVLTACPHTADPPPGEPRIEIGTGDIGEYQPLMDGDMVNLIRGAQGGQHVWVALRAWDLNTAPALIELIFENDAGDATISIPFTVRLSFNDEVPADADFTQISGLALMVPNPDDILGNPVRIRARVSENRTGGLQAESSVEGLTAQWDPDNPPGYRGEDGGVFDDGGVFNDDGGADAGAPDGGAGGDASAADAGAADASTDV